MCVTICSRNALSLTMLDSLKDALTRDIGDQDLMVIVLRSSGPVFSAGHDLKELVRDRCSYYGHIVPYSLPTSPILT